MARRSRTAGASESRALVAAATRVRLDDRKLAKKQGARRQQWQEDAWDYFDLFGFVKQSLSLEANRLSKARIFAAVANPDDPDGEPVPVDDPSSRVPPDVAAQAKAELERLKGPLGGLPEILRELDMNLEVPGEGYLVGIGARDEVLNVRTGAVEQPAVEESWQVRSTSEVHVQNDGSYRIRDDPTTTLTQGYKLDPEFDTCIRFWIPHPRFSNLPDSPMRGELEDFETLLILTRQRRAEGKSRLPSGLLLIDSNITATAPRKAQQDDGTNSTTGDVVLDAIADAIADAIDDESSASGLAPVMLRVNVPQGSDVSKMVAKVDLSRSSEQWLDGRILALVESTARGLNLPVEKVMGHQQTTYANAEQVSEDDFFDHTEPRLLLIVDLLTTSFLRPQLLAPDDKGAPAPPQFAEWAPRIFMWYDASAIVGKPDRAASADEAHFRKTISDDAYRTAKGWSVDDAPTPVELLIRVAMENGRLMPDLTKALLDLLGVDFTVTPGEGGDTSTKAAAQANRYEQVAQLLIERAALNASTTTGAAHAEPIPVRSLPTTDARPAVAQLARRHVDNGIGRKLVEIDRDLRTRLLVLCSSTMTRALERAGNRAKSKLPEARALVRRVDPLHVCSTLGPSIIAAGGVGADDLLDGAFDEIESAFKTWAAGAQREALDLAAELGTGLTSAQRDAYALRQADDLDEAWQWLHEQLLTQAHARMFNPDPGVVMGEFDPSLSVQPGMIRQAMTRAGGTIGVETKGEGDAWVSLRNGGNDPAGGIGTGEVVRDALGAGGNSIESYQWVYGPAARRHPFEPHVALDGVIFQNFDDPVLANGEGFPDYAFYLPGDHAGCICDFEPIVVPADGEQASTDSSDTTLTTRESYPGDLSAREAGQWLSDHWGDRFFDFGNLGADVANTAAAEIDELLDEFSNTAGRLRSFGASAPVTREVEARQPLRMPRIGGRAYADAAEQVGSIRLGPKLKGEAFDAMWQRDLATGYHPAGVDNGVKGIVDHEFGHHVMFEARVRAGQAALGSGRQIVSDAIDEVFEDISGTDKATDPASFYRERARLIRSDVSKYAGSNEDELIAEAFSMVRSGSPSALAQRLVDVVVGFAEGDLS